MAAEALDRFIRAQERTYPVALAEIYSGYKSSHWMWYIFPQVKGLGSSEISKRYSIDDLDEAEAFLQHPLLGKRLVEISKALLDIDHNNATQIFDFPDDMKLKSSMTLFAMVPGADPVFQQVLDKYFEGKQDDATLRLLKFGLR